MDENKGLPMRLMTFKDIAHSKLTRWRREIEDAQSKLWTHGAQISDLPIGQRMVCALLLAEDPDLHQLLIRLNDRLQPPFRTSRRTFL